MSEYKSPQLEQPQLLVATPESRRVQQKSVVVFLKAKLSARYLPALVQQRGELACTCHAAAKS